MWVKKQQLELDMEQQTYSKLGKEFDKTVYCHPDDLMYAEHIMWNAGLAKSILESRLLGEISKPQICKLCHPYGRKWRGTKEPIDESERGE